MGKIALFLALAAAAAAMAAKPTATVTVRGCVVDPDGKPVKGARLYWPRPPKTPPKSVEDFDFLERAKSDADGRFHFELPRSDVLPEWPMPVLAAADGYGADCAELPKTDAPAELTLQLVKDQPIEGRILSTEGKPLAGVRVRVQTVSKLTPGNVDDFLTAWKANWQRTLYWQQASPRAMLLPRDEKSSQAVTDKEGRFRIRGVGCDRLVLLRLSSPDVAPVVLFVVTRAGFDAAPVNKDVFSRIPAAQRLPGQPPLLYGPTFNYVALAGRRRIEGAVRESGSGKPVAGFRIFAKIDYLNGVWADSDKNGHYKIEDVPKMRQYQLTASPPKTSSWLQTRATVDDVVGVRPLRVDFTVARGVVVSGRVLDRTTGKAAPGLVQFVALPGNKFFDKPGHAAYLAERPAVWTDDKGSFRLLVFPGSGVLMAFVTVTERISDQPLSPYKPAEFDAKDRKRVKVANHENGARSFATVNNPHEPLDNEHAVKVLDVAADAESGKCNLLVDRGATRVLRIQDADGKPLMGTFASGMTATVGNAIPIKDAVGMVLALDPKRPRRLLFLHVRRKLAATLTLRGDEKQPVIVRLKPAAAVKGRLLDADGQPLAGADVNLIGASDFTSYSLYRLAQPSPIRTDKDGRFRIEAIVPDVKFMLEITQGRTIFLTDPQIGERQVKAGETLDVGDVRVTPG